MRHRGFDYQFQPSYPVSANLLRGDFSKMGSGEKWGVILPISEIGEGWLYLTEIIDLADRKIVG